MNATERRSENRKKVAIAVTVSGLTGYPRMRCAIRDASSEGCRLIATNVEELPETINIAVEGVVQPICGTVIWKHHRMVGVKFEWPDQTRELQEAEEFLELDAAHAVD